MRAQIGGTYREAQAVGTTLLAAAVFGFGVAARAQLAITEVMSQPSETFQGTNEVSKGPDWWELTNFATNAANAIDLGGYTFSDGRSADRYPLVQGHPALTIQPGQSVVLVQGDSTNYSRFTNWWGAQLAPQVPVGFYGSKPGFSKIGDGIRLYDPAGNLVDTVHFGQAQRGITFVCDTNGEFGVTSALGVCGAGWAATADDLGSPGVGCGPLPLRFLEQPTNQSVAAGAPAVFSARSAGLPRPKYTWLFDGQPLAETSRTLVIPSTGPENDGVYEVEISNYFGVLRSSPARLTVDTNPSPPVILVAPFNQTFLAEMNARFSIVASGYPPLAYQWFSNGVPMLGEVNSTLCISYCETPISGTVFCVQAGNALGSTNACATLTVIPRPNLELTEVMATHLPGFGHESWFEMTNSDTNEVNLLGWRFADNYQLDTAFQINQRLIIKPGESVVFVKSMSRPRFAAWWGADNLPSGLQIFTFDGFGLSRGEAIYFWPPGALDQFLDLYKTWSCEEFPPEMLPEGVSLWLNPTNRPFGWPSEIGVLGAFQGVETPDIGSPGYVAAPALQLLSIQRTPSEVNLKWRSIPGSRYQLQFNDSLLAGSWLRAGSYVATSATVFARDLGPTGQSRLYRVEKLP
jgi:hypothetical protein